jgi:anti-sigma B factor antagonist
VTAKRSHREVRDGTLRVRVGGSEHETTIALFGELDLANARTLSAELERAEADGADSITIDMRELEFIDSTGIAVLVAVHRRLNRDREGVRLIRSQASGVRRVMEVTGLDRELPFVAAEETVG